MLASMCTRCHPAWAPSQNTRLDPSRQNPRGAHTTSTHGPLDLVPRRPLGQSALSDHPISASHGQLANQRSSIPANQHPAGGPWGWAGGGAAAPLRAGTLNDIPLCCTLGCGVPVC